MWRLTAISMVIDCGRSPRLFPHSALGPVKPVTTRAQEAQADHSQDIHRIQTSTNRRKPHLWTNSQSTLWGGASSTIQLSQLSGESPNSDSSGPRFGWGRSPGDQAWMGDKQRSCRLLINTHSQLNHLFMWRVYVPQESTFGDYNRRMSKHVWLTYLEVQVTVHDGPGLH